MADVEGARIRALLKIETVRGRESATHETRLREEIKYTELREERLGSAYSEILHSL